MTKKKGPLFHAYFSFFFVLSIERKSFKSQLQYSFLGKSSDAFKVQTRNISENLIFGHGYVRK